MWTFGISPSVVSSSYVIPKPSELWGWDKRQEFESRLGYTVRLWDALLFMKYLYHTSCPQAGDHHRKWQKDWKNQRKSRSVVKLYWLNLTAQLYTWRTHWCWDWCLKPAQYQARRTPSMVHGVPSIVKVDGSWGRENQFSSRMKEL